MAVKGAMKVQRLPLSALFCLVKCSLWANGELQQKKKSQSQHGLIPVSVLLLHTPIIIRNHWVTAGYLNYDIKGHVYFTSPTLSFTPSFSLGERVDLL